MRLHRVTSFYILTTNWHLRLTQRVYCLIPVVPYPVATAHCSSPHVIVLHSAQRIAQILISSRKVVYTSFQESHHDYIISTRDLLPFTLSILSWFNLVLSFIGWPFYNSKSSIPNRPASPFGRITFRPPFFAMAPRSPSSLSAFAMAPRTYFSFVTTAARSPQFFPLPKTWSQPFFFSSWRGR